jgi:hypothetical protein
MFKFVKDLYNKIYFFHVIERERRNQNQNAPTFSELTIFIEDLSTGWYVSSSLFNLFHDNGEDLPEIKFMNVDGREYVYSADDTGLYSIVTGSNKGTYNYSPPIMNKRKPWYIPRFIKSCILHLFLDIIPEFLFTRNYR